MVDTVVLEAVSSVIRWLVDEGEREGLLSRAADRPLDLCAAFAEVRLQRKVGSGRHRYLRCGVGLAGAGWQVDEDAGECDDAGDDRRLGADDASQSQQAQGRISTADQWDEMEPVPGG